MKFNRLKFTIFALIILITFITLQNFHLIAENERIHYVYRRAINNLSKQNKLNNVTTEVLVYQLLKTKISLAEKSSENTIFINDEVIGLCFNNGLEKNIISCLKQLYPENKITSDRKKITLEIKEGKKIIFNRIESENKLIKKLIESQT